MNAPRDFTITVTVAADAGPLFETRLNPRNENDRKVIEEMITSAVVKRLKAMQGLGLLDTPVVRSDMTFAEHLLSHGDPDEGYNGTNGS